MTVSKTVLQFARVILLILLTGSSAVSRAQQAVLSGRVLDAETGAPLPGASVFLANTTIGTASDAAGRYTLEFVPGGPQEVVASMIGYQPRRVEISIRSDSVKHSVDFLLKPAVYDLDAVEVAGERQRAWRRQFEQFRSYFLGDSRNADRTEIVNPYVLDFEVEDGALVARATEPILLENRGLGFRINFVLNAFRLDLERERLQYGGLPHFEELEPESQREADRWQQNRLDVYRGSFQHLLWALIHDRVEEEGFRLRLDDRVNAPTSQDVPNFTMIAANDLIEPTNDPHIYKIQFRHFLQVTYEPRRSGIRSLFGSGRRSGRQVSWLSNRFPGRVHEDGSLYPPTPVVISGHMTTLRIADRLPRDIAHQLQRQEPSVEEGPLPDAMSVGEIVTYESGLPQEGRIHPTETVTLEPVVAAMGQEDWSRAVKELKPLIDRNPDDLELRYYRAIIHREIAKFRTLSEFEHWRQGVADFRYIIERDSAYRDVLYQYALYSRISAGKTDLRAQNVTYTDAIRLGHHQVRLRPDVPDNQFCLFTLYRRFLNHTRTEVALAWLRDDPSDFGAFFTAEALRRVERLEAADEILASLLERSIDIPRQPALLTRARIHYALERPEIAESFVREAIAEIERPLHAAFVFEDVKHIVNEKELEAYRRLNSADEYRMFFDTFWSRRDPLPAHAHNVRLAEHYRRLRIAEKNYAYDGFRFWINNPDQSGELTFPAAHALNMEFNDRGLVYIRLGEPTERITSVAGEAGGLRSSLGEAGKQSTFLPKDQSHRAEWLPNESWRYGGLGMDFHFVIGTDAVGENWRLTPALTNYEMMRDRMSWGGVYVQMARAAETAEEYNLHKLTQLSRSGKEYGDRNMEPASLEAHAIFDVVAARAEMADRSSEDVRRGLTIDHHTWPEDVERMDFPFLLAAFRGEGGRTNLHAYYAIPTGEIAKRATEDTVRVQVGLALHDTNWAPRVKEHQNLSLPISEDAGSAWIQTMQLSLPPDSYHVALHVRPVGTMLIGGYRFATLVPEFSAPELALSDIVLAFDITPVSDAEPSQMEDLKIVPNPFQLFARDQLIHIYFEIYHLLFGQDDLTDYTVEYSLISKGRDNVVARLLRRDIPSSLSLRTERGGQTIFPIEYAELDASDVAPGDYMLDVTVTDRVSGTSVSRSISITLR